MGETLRVLQENCARLKEEVITREKLLRELRSDKTVMSATIESVSFESKKTLQELTDLREKVSKVFLSNG